MVRVTKAQLEEMNEELVGKNVALTKSNAKLVNQVMRLTDKITRLNKDLSELRVIHVEEEAVVERATADMQSYNEERSSLQANVKELRLILANHRNFNTHMVKALSAVLDTHGIQLIIEETCNAMKRS